MPYLFSKHFRSFPRSDSLSTSSASTRGLRPTWESHNQPSPTPSVQPQTQGSALAPRSSNPKGHSNGRPSGVARNPASEEPPPKMTRALVIVASLAVSHGFVVPRASPARAQALRPLRAVEEDESDPLRAPARTSTEGLAGEGHGAAAAGPRTSRRARAGAHPSRRDRRAGPSWRRRTESSKMSTRPPRARTIRVAAAASPRHGREGRSARRTSSDAAPPSSDDRPRSQAAAGLDRLGRGVQEAEPRRFGRSREAERARAGGRADGARDAAKGPRRFGVALVVDAARAQSAVAVEGRDVLVRGHRRARAVPRDRERPLRAGRAPERGIRVIRNWSSLVITSCSVPLVVTSDPPTQRVA